MKQHSSPPSRHSHQSVSSVPPQRRLVAPRRFTLQVRLRGELSPAYAVICAGLEDAVRFSQSEFCFFTERNPWIGLDWLQRKI